MIIEINEIQGLNELRALMFGLGAASYGVYSLIKGIANYRYNRQCIDYIKRMYDKNELENLIDD